jgi:hypothetical protein
MGKFLYRYKHATPPTQLHANGHLIADGTGSYIQDYHIFQTTKEEAVMRAIRNGLQGAGIAVEKSKGETSLTEAVTRVA